MFMLWLFPKTAALLGPTLGPHATMAVAAIIALLMSFAGATLLYLLVEQPAMRARDLPGVRRLAVRSSTHSTRNRDGAPKTRTRSGSGDHGAAKVDHDLLAGLRGRERQADGEQ